MKFVLGYRTELFMIFLVPIQALQWYRFLRYSGTGSSAMMVPIRALRWYRLTDTISYGNGKTTFSTFDKRGHNHNCERVCFEPARECNGCDWTTSGRDA